jgi:hypothetical protein
MGRLSYLALNTLGAVIVAAGAGAAHADPGETPVTFHKNQVGFSARMGLGARGIATYDTFVYCGALDSTTKSGYAPVCTGRTPLSLDLEASYGVSPAIELTLEMRIGFEQDFGSAPGMSGPRPFQLAPGARFFFSEAKAAKLFVQPEVVFDLAGYSRGHDFGVRGLEGFWIDLHRSYGIYFFVSETAEFARWLGAEFEGGFGFQFRYP